MLRASFPEAAIASSLPLAAELLAAYNATLHNYTLHHSTPHTAAGGVHANGGKADGKADGKAGLLVEARDLNLERDGTKLLQRLNWRVTSGSIVAW